MKLLFLVLLPLTAMAATWPDTIGAFHKTATPKPALADKALWDELGLKESESAVYENGKSKFAATVYRLADSTAALAAYDWRRPSDAKSSKLADLAVETSNGVVLARGNYLVVVDGYKPDSTELAPVLDSLKDVDASPLPTLSSYLPSENLVPNSERYIIGPASLQKFDSGIPPSVAAFHLGAEAQLGVFHSQKGDQTLAIFNYPTNQIAMQKLGDFQKLPGAMAKRSGPLVAVILSPPDPDAAERVLAQVRYEAQITLHEATPVTVNSFARMILNIFVLIGILVAFSVIAGLFVGGFRTYLLHGRKGRQEEPMILLHLEER